MGMGVGGGGRTSEKYPTSSNDGSDQANDWVTSERMETWADVSSAVQGWVTLTQFHLPVSCMLNA